MPEDVAAKSYRCLKLPVQYSMIEWLQKAVAFFLLLLLPGLLFAQQEEEYPRDPYESPDRANTYEIGDQTVHISLGTVFPLMFYNNGDLLDMKFTPPVGGTGSISYNYFLSSKFFIGGSVGGLFNSTIGGDTLFIIPLGLRAGFQFITGKFEFPFVLSAGVSWQTMLSERYFGVYFSASGSAFYRASTEWSFGLTTSWYVIPQWTNDSSKNVVGNILELTATARYHF